jgi:hypothetical protein
MTETGTSEQAAAVKAAPKVYPTKEEAEAARPADANKAVRAFEVRHNGASKGWVLARGHGDALCIAAKLDGYAVSTGGAWGKAVTKEAVAAKLAEFSDEELNSLGLSRKPQKGARK